MNGIGENFQTVSELFDSTFKLEELLKGLDIRLSPRFLTYSPTLKIEINTGKYVLKTATTMTELIEVFKMRKNIFLSHIEEESYDLDEFDSRADHLIIVDKVSDKICGTYRLLLDDRVDHFYSQTEFNIDQFIKLQGKKMELGRACIEADHRNGAVIDLLWRGIAKYANQLNVRYLFGCSSIKTQCLFEMNTIIKELKSNDQHLDNYDITPHPNFIHPQSSNENKTKQVENTKKLIPSLLRSYLSAKAKVYGEPAFDAEFKCFDLFTVIDLQNIHPSYERRYFKKA